MKDDKPVIDEQGREWVYTRCKDPSCRGKRNGGEGLGVTVLKGDEHKAICNECYCK